MLPRRSQVRPTEHYKAMDYQGLPAFMSRLRGDSCMNARLLEFVILTAARLGEARGAVWDEIDSRDRDVDCAGGAHGNVPAAPRAVVE